MDVLSSHTKQELTLEAAEQIFDAVVKIEPPVIKSPTDNSTHEAIPRVRRSSILRVQTKQDYIQRMSSKQYETKNTQVECEDTLHPYDHMMLCQ